MDIRQLECVVEIVRNGSFTRAAESLHLTQPTISKIIKNLEEELDVRLFAREGRKVVLTDAGQVVYHQAQSIIAAFQNLSLELKEITSFRKGHIRIGIPPMIGSSFFPPVMRQFQERYPGLTVQVVEEGSKRLEEEVEKGNLDVAVVLLPTNDKLFDSYTFANESVKLIVHPEHRLAQRQEVSIAELEHEDFILFRKDFTLHARVVAECERCGFRPTIKFESAQWDFIGRLVAAKLGISMLPERICKQLPAGQVKIIPMLKPEIPWTLATIWRREGYLSFAAREWIRFTRELLVLKRKSDLARNTEWLD
jgi:DNA-binding transcriptional LysR family regulator